jgi:heptosyltransferase-2
MSGPIESAKSAFASLISFNNLDLMGGFPYIRPQKMEYVAMPKASRKILVIRLSSLGDLILMIPMLKALRASFRDGEIVLLTKEKHAGLFIGNDFLDRMILVKRGGMRELLRLRSELSRERFDIIIDAHHVIRSNLLFHTLKARKKLQIHKNEVAKILLIRGKTNLHGRIISQSERYASIAQRLGIETNAGNAELTIPDEALAHAQRLLSSDRHTGKALIAFAPGARWQTKTWPKEHFVRLIAEVSARGYTPVLIGGKEDAASNAEIAKQAPSPPLDLAGTLSIIESAAVLKKCAALVTNDSAPLHLAEAVGTPVVAFFGPTVREFGYFPRLEQSVAVEVKLPCRPCSRNGARTCPYGTKECLTAIPPEEALRALLAVLEKKRMLS